MENKERFELICSGVKRDGFENLMEWLHNTDFFKAPASTRYHGSHPGGLLEHSLNVYDEFVRILGTYPEIKKTVSDEGIIICALFHDLCKVNFYKSEKRNRKNVSGSWESYDSYRVEEKFKYGSHGGKSVFLLQNFIQLTAEEAVAINCHMGAYNNPDVGSSYEQFPLAWALHVADEAATFLVERKD